MVIGGLLTLTSLPLYAQEKRTDANSCDIYKLIEQSGKPIALNKFKQTPNGINVYSDDIGLQVANFQLCQASLPFSDNKDVIRQYAQYEQTLSKLGNKAIVDFPKEDSLSPKQIKQLESNGGYYQEQLIELYLQMALAHYLGEYIPKNDQKAIQYMSKVVDYYQQQRPEWSVWLNFTVNTGLVTENECISPNNPITLQHKTETGLNIVSTAILSKAGHLDSKAIVILEALDNGGNVPITPSQTDIEQHLQSILPKLISYAKQGSYIAAEGLGNIYTELAFTDKRYKEKADYWQQQLKKWPQADINWH